MMVVIVIVVIGLIPDSFDLPTCWKEASEIASVRQGGNINANSIW